MQIKQVAIAYFQRIFKEQSWRKPEIGGNLPRRLDRRSAMEVEAPFSLEKIYGVVKNASPSKHQVLMVLTCFLSRNRGKLSKQMYCVSFWNFI